MPSPFVLTIVNDFPLRDSLCGCTLYSEDVLFIHPAWMMIIPPLSFVCAALAALVSLLRRTKVFPTRVNQKTRRLPDPSRGFPTSRTQRLIEAPLVWEFTVFIRPKRGFPDWLSLWLCLVSFLTTSPVARCRSNRMGFAFSSYQGERVAVLTIFTCAICCLRPRHGHGGNRGTESTHTPMPAVSSL